MPPAKRSGTREGPPRRVNHRTGSGPTFACAVAASLPAVEAKPRTSRTGLRTTFAVRGSAFAVVDEGAERLLLTTPGGQQRDLVLPATGRDETRAAIEDYWEEVAPAELVKEHSAQVRRWRKRRTVTHDDIRRIVLSLPGANEGPIWGSSPGFLIGSEKRTRFARFGPPVGSSVGNLLPPDEDDTLVILYCPQKPALLAESPDRFFTTPHYGEADQPGGVIIRLAEHRGADDLRELSELLEDAWREVATPDLIDQLDRARG
jgi:hypothetical protein